MYKRNGKIYKNRDAYLDAKTEEVTCGFASLGEWKDTRRKIEKELAKKEEAEKYKDYEGNFMPGMSDL